MKIFLIIGCTIVACIAGYLFRMGIEDFNREEIIISKSIRLYNIPSETLIKFGLSFFCIVMSIAILNISL